MLNYIKSESYRSLRRKLYLFVVAGGTLLGIAINLSLVYFNWKSEKLGLENFQYGSADFSLLFMGGFLIAPLILSIIFVDQVFSDEYKNLTLKNVVSYGFSRSQIYFGKMAVELLFATVSAVIIYGIYVLSACLLLPHGPQFEMALNLFGMMILGLFPTWMGGLAVFHCAMFSTKNTMKAGIISLLGILFLPKVVDLLSMPWPIVAKLQPILLFNQISNLMSATAGQFPSLSMEGVAFNWVVGLAHVAVFSALGMVFFQRKDL